MRIAYYPGCSLEATGRAYDESTRVVAAALGVELVELEDWNCCGSTTYMGVNELLSFSLSARNLSLAEKAKLDIVAPCSACFTVLRKTDHYLQHMPQVRQKVDQALAAAGLTYHPGSVKVKHLLEVLAAPQVMERLRGQVKVPLAGLRIAPYYGCQIVRPLVDFDSPELPTMMDRLLEVLGAEVAYFPAKTRCCGASVMASNEAAALRLCKNLLLCAEQNDAQCLVTVCPLCQMNVDAFQKKINSRYGTHFNLPVLYFTQVIGLALGLDARTLGLGREITSARDLLEPFVKPAARQAVGG